MKNLSVAIVVSLSVYACLEVAQANTISQYVSDTKDYLFRQLRDGLINKSSVMSSLEETMARIKFRHQMAKVNGELVGKDESESTALYYRLVIDEVRKLRERFPQKNESEAQSAISKFTSSCNKCIGNVHKNIASQYDVDLEDEEDDLKNELDTLDSLDHEAEMGWSMDPEAKAALKTRTMNVLGDLLQNELKVLASVILTSYLAGGVPATLVGQVLGSVNVSLKSKLLEFLMHTIMDLFASMLGKKIDPEMTKPDLQPVQMPENKVDSQ